MPTAEVCIACPGRAWRIAVRLAEGATLGDALREAARDPAVDGAAAALLTAAIAGATKRCASGPPVEPSGPGEALVDGAPARIGTGVFGRARPLDWPLRDGDRVEVYRPLTVDPKAARRRRAQARATPGAAVRLGSLQ